MTEAAIQFTDADKIGRVTAVDTGRLYIDVENHDLLTRLSVGHLVAVRGTTAQEFLIGIVERVTRTTREEVLLERESEAGEAPVAEAKEDTIRAVLVGTYRTREGEKLNVFKRGADTFPQVDRDCFLITAGNLQRFMGLLGKDLPDDKRLQLGTFVADRTAVAVADGDRFFQRHASLLGSTGSGKSWAVALILERARSLAHPNLIVLDMHGEYAPLAGKGGFARRFRIAGPGDLDAPSPEALFLPFWLLNRDEMLSMLLDRSDQNAPNQASRFTTHVRALKEAELKSLKKTAVLSTFTVDSPVPYSLSDLLALLTKDNEERVAGAKPGTDKAGEWNGRLIRFISRLEAKVDDRRYGFMFRPPKEALSYDWLPNQIVQLLACDAENPGIKIIDFSEVPADVLPVVVGVFARLLHDVQFWMVPERRTPVTIVCDEAHLYLPVKEDAQAVERRALEAFERIAKEGRKYGVSLLVVSQRPSDVSRTILSQCNNFLVLRLSNDQDQDVVKRLMPESMAGLVASLPLLDVGEAVLLGDAILLPARIRLNPPSIKPDSATREFWTEWGTKCPDRDAIKTAVETLRRQTRTD